MDSTYDLLVIGAGSGGVRAARVAASLGARVAIAEESRLGGTCVNLGCIPKKLFVTAAAHGLGFENSRAYGWSAQATFDWNILRDNTLREVSRLNVVYERLLKDSGVSLLSGHARLLDQGQVEVDGQRYAARNILIATGSKPRLPKINGHELGMVSDQVFSMPNLPSKLIVVGGGYIAIEFASLFQALGVEVTLLHRGELFLRGFDREIRERLARALSLRGLDLRFSAEVELMRSGDSSIELIQRDGATLTTDAVLFAIGRVPKLDDMGIESLPIEQGERGEILVDDNYQSSLPGLYAIGDVIDRQSLTPVAIREGVAVASYLFGEPPAGIDYDLVPTAVFSLPEVACIGLSEEQAMKLEEPMLVYHSEFTSLKNSLKPEGEKSLIKLLVSGSSGRVLGAHLLCDGAAEIMQLMAVAIQAGLCKSDFDRAICLHPTLAEELVTLRAFRSACA